MPIAPSYRYYDYPYYYSRGYYPIHIRPGFIYYGYPYASYRSLYSRRHGGRCSYRHRSASPINQPAVHISVWELADVFDAPGLCSCGRLGRDLNACHLYATIGRGET